MDSTVIALALIFALLAWASKPELLLDFDDNGRRVELAPPPVAYIGWAIFCVAMIAGLVVVALARSAG